jgi:hypothetical protein
VKINTKKKTLSPDLKTNNRVTLILTVWNGEGRSCRAPKGASEEDPLTAGRRRVLLGKHTLQLKVALELVIRNLTGWFKRVNERASQTQ